MRIIDADKLEADMYHNAFEVDTDLQRWDSGCWIRYKMFENVIEEQPTVDAIPIEWIEKWGWRNGMSESMSLGVMIDDWRKENDKAD